MGASGVVHGLYQGWFTPGSPLRKGLFRHPFSLKKAGITQFPVFFGRFAFPVTRLLAGPVSLRHTVSDLKGRLTPQAPYAGRTLPALKGCHGRQGAGVRCMSVLGTIGICWLGLNAALFAALATRKS